MNRRKLLIRLTTLVIFIFLINFVSMKFHWYYSIWWLDMPVHFLGGFWLALLFSYLFSPKEISLGSILKIIFGVLVVGFFWEMYEILVNDYIAQNPFNILDTISDMAFDLAGGLAGIFYYSKRIILNSENKIQ